MSTVELVNDRSTMSEIPAVEFLTTTGISDHKRYIAIYRKWFNEKLAAWELELVPGTLRWIC